MVVLTVLYKVHYFYKYFEAVNNLIKILMKNNAELCVEALLNYMKKVQIVKKAIDYKIPFEHTWTCVTASKTACGICDPCKARKNDFFEL